LIVVFNASEKSNSSISLNDILMNGVTVQDDLYALVQRFRMHKIVMTADIEKMYRQIWIHPDDRRLQRVLWKSTPNKPIRTYELNTVTYGTTLAPFLATRRLLQLFKDEVGNYTEAAKIGESNFYVDNLIMGTDDVAACHLLTCWFLLNYFFDPERADMFLQNVGFNSTDYTASYPRR
jgi:hypothetical protein